MYNPLGDQHYQSCQGVLARCPDAIELAQACIDCGWPADDLKAELERQQKQAVLVKQKFFPERT